MARCAAADPQRHRADGERVVKGRRFIAGAICPACQALDRTVVEERGDERIRLCIDCGHVERMSLASALPRGRLETPKAPTEVPAQTVRLVTPPPKSAK